MQEILLGFGKAGFATGLLQTLAQRHTGRDEQLLTSLSREEQQQVDAGYLIPPASKTNYT